jgi:plastocyanin
VTRYLVALAGCLLLAACGDSNPSSPDAADFQAADLSPDHTISIDEDGFRPDELEIVAGDVVLLVNDGAERHSFTADDHQFDTGRMEPGDETTLVLTDPDEIPFHDVEDPDRTGVVVVAPQG